MGNQSVRVSSRSTKSLKEWGVSRTSGTGVSSRFCRISYLCRKDSHESCSRNYYFLREGRVDTTSTRRAGGGLGSEVRRPNSRRIDEHVSNDGRSNRTPMFIGEIHVTHTQRGDDGKNVRPGKDAALRHW